MTPQAFHLPPSLDAPGRAAALSRLCAERGVRRLDLFGSATGSGFDPARSDVDLLVEFAPGSPVRSAFDFIAFQDALAVLFGRKVDLVQGPPDRLSNPYFRQAVRAGLRPLLAA
jgi:uncharacterized protein